jgi:hypothetical protein
MRERKLQSGWRVCLAALGVAWAAAGRAEPPGPAADAVLLTQIELAWVADPITFPYPLRASFEDGSVVIQGIVPSSGIRKQVVNVAKVQGAAKVIDRLTVSPPPPLMTPPPRPERLRADVAAQLRKALPHVAASLQIECDYEGRATISGRVPTLDDKRTVSRTLRTVPGCSAVVNKTLLPGELPPTHVMPAQLVLQNLSRITEERPRDERVELIRLAVKKACPRASAIEIKQLSQQHFQVHMHAPDDEIGAHYANSVFQLEELQRLNLDVFVHVPRN